MGRQNICLLHFIKSTLWITVFVVRVSCIIEAYAPAGDLDDVKRQHSFEKHLDLLLPGPGTGKPGLSNAKRKPGVRLLVSRGLKSSSEDAATPPSNTDDSCTGKKDKYYPNYSSDCTSYYFCAAGYQITYVCKPGSRYNGEKCLEDYKCPVSPGNANNLCAKSPNGYYADPRNSQKYYYCYHQAKVIELTCDTGKVYDGNGRKCVRLEEFEESTKSWRDSSCRDGKKGFYPDLESGCSKYYYCIGEVKTELECQFGYLFDGDVCVQESSSTFKCPQLEHSSTTTPQVSQTVSTTLRP